MTIANSNTPCFQEGPCFLRGKDSKACKILTDEYLPGEKCPFQKASRFDSPVMSKEESLERLKNVKFMSPPNKPKFMREWNDVAIGALSKFIQEHSVGE